MELVRAMLDFPTVLFTIPLGVVLFYWLLVIVGALGIDVLDGDADAGGELDASGGEGLLTEALVALKLSAVPVTITLSFLTLWAWVFSLLGMHWFGDLESVGIPAWVTGAVVFVASLISALKLTALSVLPLAPLFVSHGAPTRRMLEGRLCTVSSGRVDASFGQASLDDGGAGLILSVFCETPNQLKAGDHAIVVRYDPHKDAYEVIPADH